MIWERKKNYPIKEKYAIVILNKNLWEGLWKEIHY